MPNLTDLNLTLNGRPVQAAVDDAMLLVDWLRGPMALTGTHVGCETAQCGACTVLLDGRAIKSCSLLAVQAAGRSVTTIEGLASVGADGRTVLHPVQEAFIACHGLQCGFCTPGFIMAATCLLQHHPQPTDAEIVHELEGNLCRCTGYVNIVAAVKQAAGKMAGQGAEA